MRGYIILCCAVCARATCNASNVLPDEGIRHENNFRYGAQAKKLSFLVACVSEKDFNAQDLSSRKPRRKLT